MEIRLQRLKERETERGRRREIKNKIEEGSNKGTHDDKMEDGDRETLMRKKKKDWRLKAVREEKEGDGCERNHTADIYIE